MTSRSPRREVVERLSRIIAPRAYLEVERPAPPTHGNRRTAALRMIAEANEKALVIMAVFPQMTRAR